MEIFSVAQSRQPEYIGREARVQGWFRARCDSIACLRFLELNDGSVFANLQIIAEASLPNYESEVKKLGIGCSVTVEGEIRESPAKGQPTELLASRITVHGMVDPDQYPLQKKGTSFEFL